MPEPTMPSLPDWVNETLRGDAVSTPAARARIMDAVRSLPRPRPFAAPMAPSRWMRRGLLSPVGGLMTTVVLMLTLTVRMGPIDGFVGRSMMGIQTASVVLGDSVVPVSHAVASLVGTDSAGYTKRLLDTLRIVEFVMRGSSIRAASVLGDFNAWKRGATPMVAVSNVEWRARVLVPRDALQTSRNVAYLVNNSRLIPARPAPHDVLP